MIHYRVQLKGNKFLYLKESSISNNDSKVANFDFVKDLEKQNKKIGFYKIFGLYPSLFIVVITLFALISDKIYVRGVIAFLLVTIVFSLWTFLLYKLDKRRKEVVLLYENNKSISDIQNDMVRFFNEFRSSEEISCIVGENAVQDARYHAGAETTVNTELIKAKTNKRPTSFFRTNIEIPYINLGFGSQKIFFLPDKILIKHWQKFSSIQYSAIEFEIRRTNTRVYGQPPQDAMIVDYTYRYVNNDGKPDKRFADNPKIPICEYTKYRFYSKNLIDITIRPSKNRAMDNFVNLLRSLGVLQNNV